MKNVWNCLFPTGPRLGNKVIEAVDVAKAYGDKCLFEELNFSLPPNGIVGVIGPNGAGKTTLFKLIMGLEKADKGSFEVGETVRIGYVDQSHEAIKADQSVYEIVSGGQEFIRVGGRKSMRGLICRALTLREPIRRKSRCAVGR